MPYQGTGALLPCPNLKCPQHGQAKQVIRFGFYCLKRGRRRRYRCGSCGKTYGRTTHTLYHRLRASQPRIARVAAMSVEGMSRAAIARVEHIDPHTVDRWLGRASAMAERFNATMTHNVLVHELQADELQTLASQQGQPTWVFTTIEVWSRLWVSTVVGARTAHNAKQLLHDTVTRGDIAEDCLVTTDGYQPYTRVMRELLGDICVYAQVVKTLRHNQVVKVTQKLIIGTSEQLEQALFRSEDSTTVNTSFIERLNLTVRHCCAYLARRRLSHARGEEHLTAQLELVRCFYNFIRPHRALQFGKVIRTPAMQAGLAARRLRFRDIFRSTATRVMYAVNNN